MKLGESIKKELISNTLSVKVDSRLIDPGDYFVAVKGDSVDGHNFINNALLAKARGVLEEKDLYELVTLKLKTIKPLIIGVTGSTGKSSVTSYIYQITKKHFNVCLGSLNTKLGLSTNVVNDMNLKCNLFICEIGMDRLGEIKNTTELFKPDIAVITNINETHLEKLGTLENIVKAKSEILGNTAQNGTAILNLDNELTNKLGATYKGKIIYFGTSNKADVNLSNTNLNSSKLLGLQNKVNLLASIAVCLELSMKMEDILKEVSHIKPPKGRLNLLEGISNCTLIDDTYNASPESTKAALNVLKELKGNNKILFMGEMLELGKNEILFHQSIGELVNTIGIGTLITVGKLGKEINNQVASKKINKFHFDNSSDVTSNFIKKLNLNKNDLVLIKGSQGSRMEKITKMLLKNPNKASKLLVRQDPRWT